MMTLDHITTLIEKCKTPYLKITDLHGNKILSIENSNVNATIKELVDMEEMLKTYGKLEIMAADAECHKANYKGCYKWQLFFAPNKKDLQVQGMPMPQQWGQVPQGYVSNEVMMAKLDMLQKQMEWKEEKMKMEREKEKEGFGQYLPFIPVVLSAMGKTDEQIGATMKHMAMGAQFGKVAYQPPTNTLTFKDVEQMSDTEKNKKIEELMNSLATKVSAEHMILLLEALNKKPELAEKAINFLPML